MSDDEDEVPEVKFKQPIRVPKSLGACADRLFELKAAKALLMKEAGAVQAEITAISDHIIEELPKSDASGVSGKEANAKVVIKTVPRVADWDKFYAHIAKTKAWELLQRRVGETAVNERWDAGKKVPGVETFQVVKVSVTKI